MMRDHGRTQKYVHEILGLNCRLSEVHAAIGKEQLKHLAEWTERRRAIAARYDALFRDSAVIIPVEKKWARHVYYMYVIRVKQRDKPPKPRNQPPRRLAADAWEEIVSHPHIFL